MKKDKVIANNSFRSKVFPVGHVLDGEYYECSFYAANFNGTRISGTFINCNFMLSEWRHVCIMSATFKNCRFIGSNFRNTSISYCTFTRCNFSDASLYGLTNLNTSTFSYDCLGLYGMSTDLRVTLISDKGVYSLENRAVKVDRKPGPVNTLDRDDMVDPEMLPASAHYRSPPSKIRRHQKHIDRREALNDRWSGYSGGMRGMGAVSFTYSDRYRYGYMVNAVLECSDIEELKRSQK